MNKKEIIEQLESLKDNSRSFIENDDNEIWWDDIMALDYAIKKIKRESKIKSFFKRIRKKKFTQQTLNSMLDRVIDEYFSDDWQGSGLWEVVNYVQWLYQEEIDTLEEE